MRTRWRRFFVGERLVPTMDALRPLIVSAAFVESWVTSHDRPSNRPALPKDASGWQPKRAAWPQASFPRGFAAWAFQGM
jgi:hypothetical protein